MGMFVFVFALVLGLGLGFSMLFFLGGKHLPAPFYRLHDKLQKKNPELFQVKPRLYILDASATPQPAKSEDEWLAWFKANESLRYIANYQTSYTDLHNPDRRHFVAISTVFLGVDHNFTLFGPPLLYETIVEGGLLEGQRLLHASREEALSCHELCVATQKALLNAEKPVMVKLSKV